MGRCCETTAGSSGPTATAGDGVAGCATPATAGSANLQCRCIVNAAGPWADRLSHSRVRLRMTKGVHLVIDRARLPIPSAVVLPEGKRILFAIPWQERVILGTTDTDYQGPIEEVVCEPADLEYVLAVVNAVFPDARLTARDVISTWAGLRPLVANWRGKPSDISRAHVIRPTEPGWWDIAGGKLTTYRLMAEQMVDRLAAYLDRKTPPCRTAVEPLLEPAEASPLVGVAVALPLQGYGVTGGGSTTAVPTSVSFSGIATSAA